MKAPEASRSCFVVVVVIGPGFTIFASNSFQFGPCRFQFPKRYSVASTGNLVAAGMMMAALLSLLHSCRCRKMDQ